MWGVGAGHSWWTRRSWRDWDGTEVSKAVLVGALPPALPEGVADARQADATLVGQEVGEGPRVVERRPEVVRADGPRGRRGVAGRRAVEGGAEAREPPAVGPPDLREPHGARRVGPGQAARRQDDAEPVHVVAPPDPDAPERDEDEAVEVVVAEAPGPLVGRAADGLGPRDGGPVEGEVGRAAHDVNEREVAVEVGVVRPRVDLRRVRLDGDDARDDGPRTARGPGRVTVVGSEGRRGGGPARATAGAPGAVAAAPGGGEPARVEVRAGVPEVVPQRPRRRLRRQPLPVADGRVAHAVVRGLAEEPAAPARPVVLVGRPALVAEVHLAGRRARPLGEVRRPGGPHQTKRVSDDRERIRNRLFYFVFFKKISL